MGTVQSRVNSASLIRINNCVQTKYRIAARGLIKQMSDQTVISQNSFLCF